MRRRSGAAKCQLVHYSSGKTPKLRGDGLRYRFESVEIAGVTPVLLLPALESPASATRHAKAARLALSLRPIQAMGQGQAPKRRRRCGAKRKRIGMQMPGEGDAYDVRYALGSEAKTDVA